MWVGPTRWLANLELGPEIRVSLIFRENPLAIFSAASLTVDCLSTTRGIVEGALPGSLV